MGMNQNLRPNAAKPLHGASKGGISVRRVASFLVKGRYSFSLNDRWFDSGTAIANTDGTSVPSSGYRAGLLDRGTCII